MKAAIDETDTVWRALGDPTRRQILDRLSAAPATTGELISHFEDLCRTAVMKHLDVLVAAGLVVVRREGRVRWNHFNPVPIEQVCGKWIDSHRRRTSGRLLRLKDVSEAKWDEENDKKGKQDE